MIVHSKQFVTNLDEKCIQPNAVDLRIDSLSRLTQWDEDEQHAAVFLGEHDKQFFQRIACSPVPLGEHGRKYFEIRSGQTYSFTTAHNVCVPEGVAGLIKVRSTLARNGLIITTGLYDSGYDGPVGGMIYNTAQTTVFIEHNSRIAQLVMFKAETAHLYDGHWNHNTTK